MPSIIAAADHGGAELKAVLVAHFQERGEEVMDLGTTGEAAVA